MTKDIKITTAQQLVLNLSLNTQLSSCYFPPRRHKRLNMAAIRRLPLWRPLRIHALLLCISFTAVLSQNSREINVDDAIGANVVFEKEHKDPAKDTNEADLDVNESDLVAQQNDQEQGILEQVVEGDGGGGGGGEQEDVQEESVQEAVADAADDLLPDVIEETEEEKKTYAEILEIDQAAQRNRTHEGDYHHPFHRPNIVEDGE